MDTYFSLYDVEYVTGRSYRTILRDIENGTLCAEKKSGRYQVSPEAFSDYFDKGIKPDEMIVGASGWIIEQGMYEYIMYLAIKMGYKKRDCREWVRKAVKASLAISKDPYHADAKPMALAVLASVPQDILDDITGCVQALQNLCEKQ